jgi:hypothetical protein
MGTRPAQLPGQIRESTIAGYQGRLVERVRRVGHPVLGFLLGHVNGFGNLSDPQ